MLEERDMILWGGFGMVTSRPASSVMVSGKVEAVAVPDEAMVGAAEGVSATVGARGAAGTEEQAIEIRTMTAKMAGATRRTLHLRG